jgi:hypothetical protein
MLLKSEILKRIKTGEVTLAFRRWVRPTVKAGGQLRTAIGVLHIEDICEVSLSDLTEDDALQAGHSSLQSLRRELGLRPDGAIYRISLRLAGPDGRRTLAQDGNLSVHECDAIQLQLRKFDRRIGRDGWSSTVLRLIADYPGVPAQDLAGRMDEEKPVFKRRVRRLKDLGLTESLTTGYRLSPRGRQALKPPGTDDPAQ